MRKSEFFYLITFSSLEVNFSIYLNKRVFVMQHFFEIFKNILLNLNSAIFKQNE